MLNRRKLIRLVLSELKSERPYVEIKQEVDFNSDRGRGKILRAIAALANSNPANRSYLILGIKDTSTDVVGVPKLDEQRLQQLVREYLSPSPEVLYENIPFPDFGSDRFIGLVTIQPGLRPAKMSKALWKIQLGAEFRRFGSETRVVSNLDECNQASYVDEVEALESRASVRLADTLDELISFYSSSGESYNPNHVVFNDQNVVCFSGWREQNAQEGIHSEVRVELLTEGVELFWSALNYVTFSITATQFQVLEHALLFWESKRLYVPLEQTMLDFTPNGSYRLNKRLVFETPALSMQAADNVVASYSATWSALKAQQNVSADEQRRLEIYPYELLLAILVGANGAREALLNFMNGNVDGSVAESHSAALNLLRKLEYISQG